MTKKILIIHTFGLGDMVMLIPALQKLIEINPNIKIDFLILQHFSVLPIKNNRYTNIIYYFKNTLKDNIDLLKKLRNNKYKYIMHSSGTSILKVSILMLFLNAENKVGEFSKFKIPWYAKQIKRDNNIHRVQSNLRIIDLVNNIHTDNLTPFFHLEKENLSFAEKFLEPYKDKLLIGIHPGCNEKFANKRWEIEKYISLIKLIETKYESSKLLIFIGPDEKDVGNEIKKNIPDILLVESSLSNVSAVISKLNLMITNDSGLGHIASCFDIDILTIFSKKSHANPIKIKPYSSKSNIIDFKNNKISDNLEVSEVFAAINRIIEIKNKG